MNKNIKLIVSLFLSALVVGCSKSPSAEWIAGSWVNANVNCDESFMYKFDKNGDWNFAGYHGTWKLEGHDLISIATARMEEGSLTPMTEEEMSLEAAKWKILKFDKNNFKMENYADGSTEEWKRCGPNGELEALEVADERNSLEDLSDDSFDTNRGSQPEQKIIWDYTGGFEFTQRYSSDIVDQRCQKVNDRLQTYLDMGWRIVSSSANQKYVDGGKCQGRDVVIER